ncbi:MAG TPA: recombinase family protein [Actinomycetota bacterium]|nr:recombinase family protein [Actinomycetota bacterium]
MRAALYARISRDREGEALGVARQEKDARVLAARLGWNVVGTYSDDDTSAASYRPEWTNGRDCARRRLRASIACQRTMQPATRSSTMVTTAARAPTTSVHIGSTLADNIYSPLRN